MIVVTGGAGFIGSHLVDFLLSKGYDVAVVDNFSSGNYVNKDAVYIKKDIRDSALVNELRDVEAIFHFAALPSVKESAEKIDEVFDVNVRGTLNMLKIAKAFNSHFIFASSSAVYGNAEIPTKEVYPCFPVSNYGASKLSAESFVSSFSKTYGIKATILRFANIYGERSRRGVMHDFFIKLKRNPDELLILGNGEQRKSYLHVGDAVKATFIAFEKQQSLFDVFNVGSEEQHSVNEIAELISRGMGLKPVFKYTGGEQGWRGDIPNMLLDIGKIKSLGWRQEIEFEEGVKRYVEWLEENV